jgi:hypothetical protein
MGEKELLKQWENEILDWSNHYQYQKQVYTAIGWIFFVLNLLLPCLIQVLKIFVNGALFVELTSVLSIVMVLVITLQKAISPSVYAENSDNLRDTCIKLSDDINCEISESTPNTRDLSEFTMYVKAQRQLILNNSKVRIPETQ